MEEKDDFFAEPFVRQQNEEQNAVQNASQNEAVLDDLDDSMNAMGDDLQIAQEQDAQSNDLQNAAEEGNQYAPQIALQNKRQDEANEIEVNEEFATEVAPAPNDTFDQNVEREAEYSEEQEDVANASLGWIGLTIAIASLFFWPAILGPAAAIVGLFAINQGSRALGVSSIILGLLSLTTFVILVPFYS